MALMRKKHTLQAGVPVKRMDKASWTDIEAAVLEVLDEEA